MDVQGWLRKHLEKADTDLLRDMVIWFVQALMGAEADAACGASLGERSAGRINQRNGYRPRRLDTRVGTLELAIPKLRQGSYFPDWLLEPRRRTGTCPGRRRCRVLRAWGVHPPGGGAGGDPGHPEPVQVSGLRARQDPRRRSGGVPVSPTGRRPVPLCVGGCVGGQVPRGRADRECGLRGGHRGQRRWPPGVARGRCAHHRGRRRLDSVPARSGRQRSRRSGAGDLRRHAGLKEAIAAVLPGSSWQRCRTHFMRNLLCRVPKSAQALVATLVRTVFAQPDAASTLAQHARIVEQLSDRFPAAAELLADAAADLLAFTAFPKEHWRQIWSNNPQERLNKELRGPHRRRWHLSQPIGGPAAGWGGAGRAA
jgi:putative transposase